MSVSFKEGMNENNETTIERQGWHFERCRVLLFSQHVGAQHSGVAMYEATVSRAHAARTEPVVNKGQ